MIDPARADELARALAPLGAVEVRRMFGGAGVYCDGRMFGLLHGSDLYLRTDAIADARFDAEDCPAFAPMMKGRAVRMPYRRAPDAAQHGGEPLLAWARLGVDAAARVAAAPSKSRRRRAG